MRWVFLLILYLSTWKLTAQSFDTVHVACTVNATFIIPPEYKDTIFNYEEGFFKTFFWINGDILDIQCGSLSEVVYITDTVRFEKEQVCEDKQRKTITGIEKKTGRCWGVVKFKSSRIKASYICLPERKSLFDTILQEILLE